ncbi:hypothetical protein [Pararhizobium qamdonense]|uniref:hypothetical protein n=1 Tax=Pararhizobium qamdonense TaxID=3031126 RepID=UPI0023E1A395|nr:hypothetical protein [Pararhizobium qamdonense]
MKTGLMAAAIWLTLAAGVCQSAELADWQTRALQQVKLKDGVVNARWRSAAKNALWVSMDADRYHADGFSRFVCDMLKDAGAPPGTTTSVSVFDPLSYSNSGWPMGTAECH